MSSVSLKARWNIFGNNFVHGRVSILPGLQMKYLVTVGYDPAGVYYVHSSNVPGLQASAWSAEALSEIVRDAVPNLVHDSSARVTFQQCLVLCALPKHRQPQS